MKTEIAIRIINYHVWSLDGNKYVVWSKICLICTCNDTTGANIWGKWYKRPLRGKRPPIVRHLVIKLSLLRTHVSSHVYMYLSLLLLLLLFLLLLLAT